MMSLINFSCYRLTFSIILLLTLFLHFFRINLPAKPVFDEVYFATFAANYAKNEPHFDVHPPLGKIIYSFPLLFQKDKLADAPFIVKEKVGREFMTTHLADSFGGFPYLNLRFLSAIFGVLLAVSIYFFIKNLTGNKTAALLGMFFVAFENALLLETQLILLNGMYLALGFLALALLFREKPVPLVAGILWGLALSVKLIAAVFLGPAVIYFLVKNKHLRDRRLLIFLTTGFGIFFLILFFINGVFVAPIERLNYYHPLDMPYAEQVAFQSYLGQTFQSFLVELNISLSGYMFDVGFHPFSSQWFQWPFMLKPMNYDFSGGKILTLIGNPAVWFLGTVAIFLAILKFRKYPILLGGYIFSLIPFMFVQRVTFLYHYFPALIFAITLAAAIIAEKIEPLDAKEKRKWLFIIIGTVIFFFFVVSPFTFAL
jgi:dolichyl-phosphate-mannose--protein O-mannosyl transferase